MSWLEEAKKRAEQNAKWDWDGRPDQADLELEHERMVSWIERALPILEIAEKRLEGYYNQEARAKINILIKEASGE